MQQRSKKNCNFTDYLQADVGVFYIFTKVKDGIINTLYFMCSHVVIYSLGSKNHHNFFPHTNKSFVLFVGADTFILMIVKGTRMNKVENKNTC
jgi:hypothetical protein